MRFHSEIRFFQDETGAFSALADLDNRTYKTAMQEHFSSSMAVLLLLRPKGQFKFGFLRIPELIRLYTHYMPGRNKFVKTAASSVNEEEGIDSEDHFPV